MTVGQARQHAEITAALRTERSDWTTATSTGRGWQTERDATDELDVAAPSSGGRRTASHRAD